MTRVAKRLVAKLVQLLDRPKNPDPVEAAWDDFQNSWDWSNEPPSREIFAAGYKAGQSGQVGQQH